MNIYNVNIFNLSTSDSITVDKIAEIIIEEMGLKNVEIKYTGDKSGWPGDVTKFLLDISRLKNLGWSAKHNSEEAVRITARRMLGRN